MYKIHQTGFIRLSDNVFIPPDIANADYLAFLGWQASGNTPEPAVPTDLKAEKLAEVNKECDRRINAFMWTYPDTERLTFSKQESEARAFIADDAAPTPLMDALADARGIAKADLASRIIAKADLFAAFTGAIVGYRQKLADQLNAPGANLDAIDPLAGWPG